MTFEADVIDAMFGARESGTAPAEVAAYDRVASLARMARVADDELPTLTARDRSVISAMAAEMRGARRATTAPTRRRPWHVAVAVGAAAMTLSATAAAADVFPTPIQNAISNAVSYVGIPVPSKSEDHHVEAPANDRSTPVASESGAVGSLDVRDGSPSSSGAREPDDASSASNAAGASSDEAGESKASSSVAKINIPGPAAPVTSSASNGVTEGDGKASDAPGHGGPIPGQSDSSLSEPSNNSGGNSEAHRQNLR